MDTMAGGTARRRVGLAATLAAGALMASAGTVSAASSGQDVITKHSVFTMVKLHASTSNPGGMCLEKYGTGVASEDLPQPGQVVVGFNNFFDPGTQPFPCQAQVNNHFRGYVKFASSKIVKEKYKTGHWQDAFLRFDLIEGRRTQFGVVRERGAWSSLYRLGYLKSGVDTKGGIIKQGPAFHLANFYAHKYPTGLDVKSLDKDHTIFGGAYSIKVNKLFKEWLCDKRNNQGFALKGGIETFGQDNDEFISKYGNFKLVVHGTNEKHKGRRC